MMIGPGMPFDAATTAILEARRALRPYWIANLTDRDLVRAVLMVDDPDQVMDELDGGFGEKLVAGAKAWRAALQYVGMSTHPLFDIENGGDVIAIEWDEDMRSACEEYGVVSYVEAIMAGVPVDDVLA